MSENRPDSAEASTFFIAAILLAQGSWTLAYHLGKTGDIAITHLFAIWAASIGALIAILFVGRTSDGETYFTWTGLSILLLPTLWFATEILFSGGAHLIRLLLTIATLVLAVPYLVYAILQCAIPELAEIRRPRLWAGLALVVVVIGSSGWWAGSNHEWFEKAP